MRLLLVIVSMAVIVPGGPNVEAGQKPVLQIAILGDSTVADYPANSNLRGWGQVIGKGFKEGVTIHNFAANGRSTKTFIAEGLLKKSLKVKADFALIQFGHNDSHKKGNPESTDAGSDYKDNLRVYVDAFRKAGTQPILVTPMHRRTFKGAKLTDELKPYADAMKAVATEMKVPVVDLYAASGELFERLGDAGSADLSGTEKDRTHFSEKGAHAMAELVLQGLKKASPKLAELIR